jgi:RNA polymerase sigma-70 factor (ECF subfamily)
MLRILKRLDFARGDAVRSDEELVRDALSGQTAAFAELASRHRKRVERLCQRFFHDQELVQDLSQEALIRAFSGLPGYRAEMPFGGWLRAITVNIFYDELRRRRRRPEELFPDFSAVEVGWMHLVSEASPEEIIAEAQERREAYELAHRLLDTLRPEDRTVLVLKDSEGLSVSEIARLMAWSEAKVKIRAFRARQSLRKRAQRMLADGRGQVKE